MSKMRLREFLQKYAVQTPMGGGASERGGGLDAVREDLRRVQRTNEIYFRSYWVVLVLSFVVTFVLALVYNDRMGGLAVVLGAGGMVQSGLLLRLSAEWKDKARIDIVSALAVSLPPTELPAVLKDILAATRE